MMKELGNRSNGQGIGSIYCIGTFIFDTTTVIEKNVASTGNDIVVP